MRVHRQRLLTAALSLYGLALAVRPLDEADTFFHLSLGRAVLRAGSRVVPEPTAFRDFTAPAVAFEWLWSVLSYAVYSLGGYTLLTLLGCVLSALACWSAVLFTQRTRASAEADGWVAAVSVLAVCSVICRVSVRPELALLCGLPWYVLAARAYAEKHGRARLLLGAALVLGCVVWAQLHGSFVLCPVLFVVCVVRRDALERRRELQADGLVLLLLLAAQLSGPAGVHIGEQISAHAAGDAPRYISEMARPSWAGLDPFAAPNVAAYLSLVLLGGAGMLIERRWYARELLLLLLGAALFAAANRFIAEAALLAVPFANQGAGGISLHYQGRAPRLTLLTVSAVLLGVTAVRVQALHGPLGHLGAAENALALHAADAPALVALPNDAPVLTDYASSAVVGFVGRDRLRTFVDGRTPLYFDATDFAVSREMGRDKVALRNGLSRYGARAAVFRRDSEACLQLAAADGWSVALLEPLYTTFVQLVPAETQQAMSMLRPCGVQYIPREACEGAALQADIARVRDAGALEFAGFLEAARDVRCGGDVQAALPRVRALEASARPYRSYYDRVLIEALLRAGDFETAPAEMLRAIEDGDVAVIGTLQLEAAAGLPLSAARKVLSAYLERAGDEADIGVRAALAEICARAGDDDCARFQATRAAVRGRSTSALTWLAEHHEDARVRRDAKRWLEVLRHTATPHEQAAVR